VADLRARVDLLEYRVRKEHSAPGLADALARRSSVS
jgi:hypothetical protein